MRGRGRDAGELVWARGGEDGGLRHVLHGLADPHVPVRLQLHPGVEHEGVALVRKELLPARKGVLEPVRVQYVHRAHLVGVDVVGPDVDLVKSLRQQPVHIHSSWLLRNSKPQAQRRPGLLDGICQAPDDGRRVVDAADAHQDGLVVVLQRGAHALVAIVLGRAAAPDAVRDEACRAQHSDHDEPEKPAKHPLVSCGEKKVYY